MIELEDVSVSFPRADEDGRIEVLRNINLACQRGRFVCLVGPSGCGKSTILNMVAGLLKPSSGRVKYGGTEVTGVNSNVGYISQRDTLLPWRRLEDNVGLALDLQRVGKKERNERVAEMLDDVGLGKFAKFYPSQLSGGMRKRATVARTLIYGPETLLMDEPFGAVDAIMRVDLHEMLLRLWERAGLTVLFVTHDLEEALVLADEVVIFGTNPGRVVHVQDIPFARPRNLIESRSTPEFGRLWQELWSYLDRSGTTSGDG